jgi:hypothetical protein
MIALRTTILSALGASVSALTASSAWALTPDQVNALAVEDIIYVSGSTSLDAAIQAWAKLEPQINSTGGPFTAGSYDLYKTATGYVLTGTATRIFGPAAGQNIAIVKQTRGGSAVGIHNVAQGLPTNGFPDLTILTRFTSSCDSPVNTPASQPFQAFNTYTCTQAETFSGPNGVHVAPNAGISDLDPTTFVGTGGVTVADTVGMAAGLGVQVPFAIIVSVALRNALQASEGLIAGSEALADVPYLTSAQARAILSGQMTTLTDLYESNPTTGKTTQIDTTGSVLHICRRGDTSGAQLAANIYFFGQGCSKGAGVGSIASPDSPSTQATGEPWSVISPQVNDFVFAGASTTDVTTCVAAGLGNGDTFNARIGFVSTDQISQGQNWRYIGLNGVAPTIWNVQLGRYDWLTEDTFNSTTASLALNGGPGNHAAIFNTLLAFTSSKDYIAGLNAATRNSAASADTSGGAADTGLLTLGNLVLYGASNPKGPSAPAWPAAIRAIGTPGQGPNSPLDKTYPGQALNGCNGAFQADPTG